MYVKHHESLYPVYARIIVIFSLFGMASLYTTIEMASTDTINTGELVPLPDEVVSLMAEKRLQEISKRPYTEIQRTFTRETEERKRHDFWCILDMSKKQKGGAYGR